jgi:hypothetical protein
MLDANTFVDAIGWLGALILLVAYALVSLKRLEGDSTAYQVLNLGGGALLIINSFFYGAHPSVTVNLFWIGIALYTLVSSRGRGG